LAPEKLYPKYHRCNRQNHRVKEGKLEKPHSSYRILKQYRKHYGPKKCHRNSHNHITKCIFYRQQKHLIFKQILKIGHSDKFPFSDPERNRIPSRNQKRDEIKYKEACQRRKRKQKTAVFLSHHFSLLSSFSSCSLTPPPAFCKYQ